ncbi:PREDICTED: LOC109950343 partial [Prunus dulcis]|uniref:PREDICTED: LOC109950343 partial n=1 Tax=Prunus dulcis TaxID=3755 RepID=A0A5E4FPM7_PRUDU|nr:PREDICTED: LOC109950343 partial [Prunus dulcis]
MSGRNRRVFPSQANVNPKNQEQEKAITLRLGKKKIEQEKEAEKFADEVGHEVEPPLTTTQPIAKKS